MIGLKKSILLFAFGGLSRMMSREVTTPNDLITDSPAATESPNTVPKKTIQVETGAFFQTYDANGTRTETIGYNTTLVRYGVFDIFELRLGWNFEEIRTTVGGAKLDDVKSGFSPLLAGIKVEIVEEKGLIPQTGLLVHMALPFTASDDFRPQTTGVDFRFSMGHTLSNKSSLGYNLGAQWGDDSSVANYLYTLVYGYSISEKIGFYVEIYGDASRANKPNHFWDAGFTYLISNVIQADATIGKSFTEGQDILVSMGLSFRIPK
jgi:hypothetical protein